MLLYFFTCISIIFFLKSLPLKLLSQGASEMSFVSLLFCKESSLISSVYKLIRNHLWSGFVCQFLSRMSVRKNTIVSKVEANVENTEEMTVLDLPELVLECILERLPPASLCNMAGVCNSLRERCVSGHLWQKHMKEKWGRIIGPAAYREWQRHIATKTDIGTLKQRKQKGLFRILSMAWPFSWIRSKVNTDCRIEQSNLLPVDSIMARYIALETGKFSFPAQVYNRENGHVGFMLSCYDAELSYDPRTDTFQARYPPHGRRAVAIENGIPWERLRAAPVDTPPHDLHVSDCLNELRPGDHIEIQWRRNKEFPYGWWYGVVGHLDSCDGTEIHCRCPSNESVVLEFNHYTPGSRWRRTTIDRKNHREEGNEADGFYGGIRKLDKETEISTWKRLWPSEVLD